MRQTVLTVNGLATGNPIFTHAQTPIPFFVANERGIAN